MKHHRCTYLWLFLTAYLSLVCGAASAGIDEVHTKPNDRKSWGEQLIDFIGLSGYQKSYAFVVGINEYNGGYKPLPTKEDPLRMRDYLLNEAGFDYVHVLTNDKATKARIEELMVDRFRVLVKSNDRFLLYWSGHGEQLEVGPGYKGFLPLTATQKGKFSKMVSMDDIRRWDDLLQHTRQVRAKRRLSLPTTWAAASSPEPYSTV